MKTRDEAMLAEVREQPCIACNGRRQESQTRPHHVTTVKSGGPDTRDNLMPLCDIHHYEWHFSGPSKLIESCPSVWSWLIKMNRIDILHKIKRSAR